MKINRFIGGLAGIILAACGQENNTGNNSNGNNNSDGGYSDANYVLDSGSDGGSLDGNYVDGGGFGDGGADGGQDNLPPVVIIEAKDDQGNVKNTFNVGEWVTYDLNKSYDPDCEKTNTCGQSKGMKYCDYSTNLGGSDRISFPNPNYSADGTMKRKYGAGFAGKTLEVTFTCYDLTDVLGIATTLVKIN